MGSYICESQNTFVNHEIHLWIAFRSFESRFVCLWLAFRLFVNYETNLTPYGSAVDFYRPEFYRVLDTVDAQITERFMQPGIQTWKELENSLLTPKTNDAAVRKYPELNGEDLRVQLALFKNKYKVNTTADAVPALKEMLPKVRGLFDQVETLVRPVIKHLQRAWRFGAWLTY